jgi:membrane-bound serine protease (ClpP class)
MQETLILAYALILIGLLLLVAEVFIPSAGVLFVLAVCGLVGGVAMTFLHGGDHYLGWITLIALFIIIPVLGRMLFVYWPKTAVGKRFLMPGPEEDATIASMPVNLELEQLRGKIGRAISALRPAGVVDFDGKRIDTITEGMMVEPGQWVRCIDVHTGKVIVRPIDPPDLSSLEKMHFE